MRNKKLNFIQLLNLKYNYFLLVLTKNFLNIVLFFFLFLLINCSGGGGSGGSIISNNNSHSDQENISSDLDSSLNEIFSLFNELGI